MHGTQWIKRDAQAVMQILPMELERLEAPEILAVGNSSFTYAEYRAMQAGYMILTCGPGMDKSSIGSVSFIGLRSPRPRRTERRTLSAATMPMCGSIEHANSFRARFVAVTDCSSRFGPLNKEGSSPPLDQRLALGLQIVRHLVNDCMSIKRVATCKMVADGLTKQSFGNYLSKLLRAGILHLIKSADAEFVYEEERALNTENENYVPRRY